jgi:hypothetical protein
MLLRNKHSSLFFPDEEEKMFYKIGTWIFIHKMLNDAQTIPVWKNLFPLNFKDVMNREECYGIVYILETSYINWMKFGSVTENEIVHR